MPYHLEPHQKRAQDQFERTLYDLQQEKRGIHAPPEGAARYITQSSSVNLGYTGPEDPNVGAASIYKKIIRTSLSTRGVSPG